MGFLRGNYKPLNKDIKISEKALRNIAIGGSYVIVKGGSLFADHDKEKA